MILTRVLRSLNAMFWGQVIARVGSFLLVPAFLLRWGVGTYGEYLSIFALVAYLATIDLGLSQAAVNHLTQAHVRNDREEYLRTLHSSLAYYASVALLATAVLVVGVFLFPLPQWLGLKSMNAALAMKVTILIGLTAVWGLPIRFLFNLYRTAGRMHTTQWFMNAAQLITLALTGLVLWLGKGILAVSTVQLFGLLLVFLVFVPWLKKDLPWVTLSFGSSNWARIKETAALGALFYLLTLSNVLTFQGTTVAVAALMGGAGVAAFSVVRTLSSFIRMGVDAFNTALWPEITRLDHLERGEDLRTVHRMLVAGAVTLACAGGALLWTEGADFLRLWTQGRLTVEPWFLRMMVLQAVLQVLWLAGYSVLGATNKHRQMVYAYVASAIAGLVAAVLLLPRWGLVGVPLGLIFGEFVFCLPVVLKRTCQITGESPWSFGFRTSALLAATFTTALLVGHGTHLLLGSMPFVARAFAVAVAVTISSATLIWVLWLKSAERSRLQAGLKGILEGGRAASA